MLDKKYFTAKTTSNHAGFIHSYYIAKLNHSLSVIADNIKISTSSIERFNSFIKKARAVRKLPPSLFFYYFKLKNLVSQAACQKTFEKCISSITKIDLGFSENYTINKAFSENWEKEALEDLEKDNSNVGNLFFKEPVNEKFNQAKLLVLKALDLLQELKDPFNDYITEYLQSIKLCDGNLVVGASSPKFFGSIYIKIPKHSENHIFYYCEHIIHEVSHLHLDCLFACDKLILNPPTDRYPAPIRTDLRPMYGVFHATFVLSKMKRIFNRLNLDFSSSENKDIINSFYENISSQFEQGFSVLKKNGIFTEKGQQIFDTLDIEANG